MLHARDRFLLFLPLLIGAAMLAAGCTPDAARWSQTEAPKENRVEFVALNHEVPFAPGSTALGAAEQQRLAQFLDSVELGYGDKVTLDTGPSRGAPEADALAAKRLQAVRAALRRMQVNATPASRPSVAAALSKDAVVVTVGRYVVTPPSCPDFTKPEPDDYTNTPPSNYGCATMTNLGFMVANPADLVHGTPTSSADAEFLSRGIQRYRSGEIAKSIKPELPKLYSGGGGGGGQ